MLLEEYDGVFKNGIKNGFGKLLKLKALAVDKKLELDKDRIGQGLEYNEYIGDFRND
jgi:hypothetical protein